MKIGSSFLFQPSLPKQDKKDKTEPAQEAVNVVQQMKDARQELRELAQQQIAEMEAARTDMGEDDPKAQRLIEKFKNGKKLTAEEMAYVRKNAPGMVDYIDKIIRERQVMELSMRAAPSKTEVQMVAIRASKQIEKHYTGEEQEIRMKHLADAKQEYEQTEEYKEKPNSPLDREERPKRIHYKKSAKHQVQHAIQVYQHVNFEKKESLTKYEK